MLKSHSADFIASITSPRAGELKIGQEIEVLQSLKSLKKSQARFIVLGLKEDIGIRANLGVGGARMAYDHFLKAFVNMQSNGSINVSNIALLGALEFDDWLVQSDQLDQNKPEELAQLRDLCAKVDQHVCETVKQIIAAGKTPIIIGGGHNNSYGNIAGCSTALNEKINVLNIDPHADFRALEGRHSGNGFSYARHEGFLNRYAVWGLYPAYNNQQILDQFNSDKSLHFVSFEELLSLNHTEKDRSFKNLLHWLGIENIGLELDMDSLSRFPVSALNPSGFHLNDVRALVRTTVALRNPLYFHLCEASPARAHHAADEQMLGKALALLAWDFINSYSA